MSVLVFGSLNMDVVFKCDQMPKPGETVLCPSYTTGPGGKGLNQAVAARRAGSEVHLVGAIGSDGYGSEMERFLVSEGISCDELQKIQDAATGIAHIAVDHAGENSIIVASGANGAITGWCGTDKQAAVWLAQLELSPAAVAEFFRVGRSLGAICMLNAAPAIAAGTELFPLCDIIVVNEHELADYAGGACDPDLPDSLSQAAGKVADLERQVLIVTLGARGTQVFGSSGTYFVPAMKVTPCDTTGAGDCFCGVLADGLASGLEVVDAVRRANAAAAIGVQREGAALAMPLASEIAVFQSNVA